MGTRHTISNHSGTTSPIYSFGMGPVRLYIRTYNGRPQFLKVDGHVTKEEDWSDFLEAEAFNNKFFELQLVDGEYKVIFRKQTPNQLLITDASGEFCVQQLTESQVPQRITNAVDGTFETTNEINLGIADTTSVIIKVNTKGSPNLSFSKDSTSQYGHWYYDIGDGKKQQIGLTGLEQLDLKPYKVVLTDREAGLTTVGSIDSFSMFTALHDYDTNLSVMDQFTQLKQVDISTNQSLRVMGQAILDKQDKHMSGRMKFVVTNLQGDLTTNNYCNTEIIPYLSDVTAMVQHQINQLRTTTGMQKHNIGAECAGKVLVTDASGNIEASAIVNATALNYIHDITGDVQSQINILNQNIGVEKQNHNLGIENGNKVLFTDISGSIKASQFITSSEVGFLEDCTANIQWQINNIKIGGSSDKQNHNIGVSNGLRPLVTDNSGNISASHVIDTQHLNYIRDVTSNIQAQIDSIIHTGVSTDATEIQTIPVHEIDNPKDKGGQVLALTDGTFVIQPQTATVLDHLNPNTILVTDATGAVRSSIYDKSRLAMIQDATSLQGAAIPPLTGSGCLLVNSDDENGVDITVGLPNIDVSQFKYLKRPALQDMMADIDRALNELLGKPISHTKFSDVTLELTGFKTALAAVTGLSTSNILFTTDLQSKTLVGLWDCQSGEIKCLLNGIVCGSKVLTSGSDIGQFEVLDILTDAFISNEYKIDMKISGIPTTRPIEGSNTLQLTHPILGETNVVRFEHTALIQPLISNYAYNIPGDSTNWESGVPIIVPTGEIEISFDIDNAVSKYYQDKVATISGPIIHSIDITPTFVPAINEVIKVANQKIIFTEGNRPKEDTNVEINMVGFNADNVSSPILTKQVPYVVGGVAEENIRKYTGNWTQVKNYAGNDIWIPSTGTYTTFDSEITLQTYQYELQFYKSCFRWPSGDFSTDTPAGPNYSGNMDNAINYRWMMPICVKMENVLNFRIDIKGTGGLWTTDWLHCTEQFKLYVKVVDDSTGEDVTKIIDCNANFVYGSNPGATDEGIPAMGPSSTATSKDIYFGNIQRSGLFYIYAGIAFDSDMTFESVDITKII